MTLLTLNLVEKNRVNMSMTQKWLSMLLIGLALFITKTVTLNALLTDQLLSQADNALALISRYHLTADLISSVIFIVFLYWVMSLIKKQILVTKQDLAKAIADGGLEEYAHLTSKDELGDLARMVCSATGPVQQALQRQGKSALELGEVSESLLTCMEIITDSMDEEFLQIDQVATAMNEMTATVSEVASNASSASSATAEAAEAAQQGSKSVDATVVTINSLSSNIGASADAVKNVELKVEGIGSVVVTIRSISEQTNLLALNAAIEAARAGEAGRGFAVVADEVRNLAKRTQDATVEIQGMIEQLQSSAQDAVALMDESVKEGGVGVEQITQAGTQLAGIVEKISHISDMNYQIASAAEEQTTVAADINKNLDEVKEVVDGSVTVFKEVTEMAQMISKTVQDLNK